MTGEFVSDPRRSSEQARLAAAGLLPALAWTVAVFVVQLALYGAWFAHRVDNGVPPDNLTGPILVLILVTPLFDAAVFAVLFLGGFPLLSREGQLAVPISGIIVLNSLAIGAGALALVGSGCHVILSIASLPAILGAAAGAWRHEMWLRADGR